MCIKTSAETAFNEEKATYFLIDDFASELDQYKRALLAGDIHTTSGSQVLLPPLLKTTKRNASGKAKKIFLFLQWHH